MAGVASAPPVVADQKQLSTARPAVVLLAAWSTLGLSAAVWPAWLGVWLGAGVAVALVLVADAVLVAMQPTPTVSRQVNPALALGEWHSVLVRVDNPATRNLNLEVHDAPPEHFRCRDIPRNIEVAAGRWTAFTYKARPTERGWFILPWIEIRLTGPLGLMRQKRRLPLLSEGRVYPNFKAVSRFALLATDNRVAEVGVHTRQRRGQGLEFMQLREYRQGDPIRQIDWKAVSRRNQLISREYREEQNQQIVFLLDCGRRMRSQDGELSYFDHVLNAVLLLSYVALKQGDAVGACTFSGHDRFLPPRKGHAAMNVLLNGLFDIQPTTAPTDYTEAATRIATRLKRRALVILVSNLRDDDASELPLALAPLRKKHLVLFASLREPTLDAVLQEPADTLADALQLTAGHGFAEARRKTLEQVRGRGVQTLDILPAELPVALVNRYFDIKRAGQL